MKSKAILTNWILSFMALSIDTDKSSFIAVIIVFAWFLLSTVILIRTSDRGIFKTSSKHQN